ncbi:MAG: hypothetical protein Q8S18_06710, partial [Bacteroidales bacterium]|nr:hypothetical protein [Bacteroidales bacterium]
LHSPCRRPAVRVGYRTQPIKSLPKVEVTYTASIIGRNECLSCHFPYQCHIAVRLSSQLTISLGQARLRVRQWWL